MHLPDKAAVITSGASDIGDAIACHETGGRQTMEAIRSIGGEAAFERANVVKPEKMLEEENPLLLREMYLSIQCLSETVQSLIQKVERIQNSTTTRQLKLPASPNAWEELLQELFGLRLSETERRVCARRVIGHAESEIATALSLSNSTVKTHTAHIVEKFGLESTRESPFLVLRHLLERKHTT